MAPTVPPCVVAAPTARALALPALAAVAALAIVGGEAEGGGTGIGGGAGGEDKREPMSNSFLFEVEHSADNVRSFFSSKINHANFG